MNVEDIENIELRFLSRSDYEDLKAGMIEAYPSLEEPYWTEQEIESLIEKFPDGQIIIRVNGELAGCALSIIVDYDRFSDAHTYQEITANYTFESHDDEGDVLYGIDIFILPEFRGLRLGRRMYDYRKELVEKMNLKGIAFGGRIPEYHQYASEMSPKE